MTETPTNRAAWLPGKHAALEVRPAPYRSPGSNEIVIKNKAVAVNPVDWAIPIVGDLIFPWVKFPTVIGSDVAGEVVEVGQGVSRFKVGDRVLGFALGMSKKRFGASEGAFQDHTLLMEHMASPIPKELTYESASVLPLGLSTASCGLFQKDQLALQLPSETPSPTGKTLVIWGGSTSVGSNAIQLALAAGYEVFTTSSPANFAYCKTLGASQVFDYKSQTVVADILQALEGKTIAGALAIGNGSSEPCLAIVQAAKGDKFVSTASAPLSLDHMPAKPGLSLAFVMLMGRFVVANLSFAVKCRVSGVRTKFIFGDTLAWNEVGEAIYVGFLPKALADGRYLAAPDPVVVGHGLGQIQAGLEAQRKGVSARKVVISL